MERLKRMKESLMNCIEGQVQGHLSEVDTKELGEAIDMVKDLSEAIYYCTITEAMGDDKEEYCRHDKMMYKMYNDGNNSMGGGHTAYMYPCYPQYDSPMYYDPMMYRRGVDGSSNGSRYTMYRGGNSSNGSGSSGNSSSSMAYHEPMMLPPYERDMREGRSPMRRKMYMEGKKTHNDKVKQMQELESYMQELSTDMAEMIQDASPEEKQLLQQKIAALATKIK